MSSFVDVIMVVIESSLKYADVTFSLSHRCSEITRGLPDVAFRETEVRIVQHMDVKFTISRIYQASLLHDGKALTLRLMDMRHWERRDTQIWGINKHARLCVNHAYSNSVGIRMVYVWLKI